MGTALQSLPCMYIVFQNEEGELETGISKTSSKVLIVFIGSGLFFVAVFLSFSVLLQHPNYNAECNYGQPFASPNHII